MPLPLFSPRNLEYRPEHGRASSWFATLCRIFSEPKFDTTCHLQEDGSVIFKFGEDHGRKFEYHIRVWPSGEMRGGREVPNSE